MLTPRQSLLLFATVVLCGTTGDPEREAPPPPSPRPIQSTDEVLFTAGPQDESHGLLGSLSVSD